METVRLFLPLSVQYGLDREEGASRGYESSSEESIEEENNLVGRDMDKSMEEVSLPGTGRGLSGRAEPRRREWGSQWEVIPLSTSSPSPNSLRPCILAIRGRLRPRELPLWSLKPPYCPEKTLVSPLSEIPNLGTPS
jgi:hypothetical protein